MAAYPLEWQRNPTQAQALLVSVLDQLSCGAQQCATQLRSSLPESAFVIRLTLVLSAIVFAVVFAAQNADVVNLSLLGWNMDASLAVIIVLCFAAGALVAALALSPGIYRSRS